MNAYAVRAILDAMTPQDRAAVLAEAAHGMDGVGSWLSKAVRSVAPVASALIPGFNAIAAPYINTLWGPQTAPTAAPSAPQSAASSSLVPIALGAAVLFALSRKGGRR